MPTPSHFLSDKREGELADAVWRLADTLPGRWKLQLSHEVYNNAAWPWMNKKIIWARDWITVQREGDGQGGVTDVNRELNSNYTAIEIGDVEHFYVAALLGTIGGPTGGIMLNIISCPAWELVVGPTRIAWSTKDASKVWTNIKYNWGQLTGPDAAGALFGSLFYLIDLRNALSNTASKR